MEEISRIWRNKSRRTCRTRRFGLAGLCVILCSFSMQVTRAHGESLYKTDRMIGLGGAVCLDYADCKTNKAEPQSLDAGRSAEFSFECPADRPYLRNWDAAYHEHIALSVSPARIGKGTALVLIAHNQADAPGQFQVVLGCGAAPASIASMTQSLGSLPTNVKSVRGAE